MLYNRLSWFITQFLFHKIASRSILTIVNSCMPIQLVSGCGYLTVFTLIKELYAFLVQYYENRIEHFIISF